MIRVASVPACHPYVHAVSDPNRLFVLPDPEPRRVDVAGQWWPPRWLEPEYLLRRIDEIDVMHVHFGFDATPVADLTAVCDITAEHHVPLVLTVHDLHNPHFVDAQAHLAKLDVLVPAASRVVTLTPGAARIINERWSRTAVVLPHPHLLPLYEIGEARVHRARPVVAVHGKSLRANHDPWSILDIISSATLDVTLRFDLDEDAFASPHAPPDLLKLLCQLKSRGVDVRVHPPFSDADLSRYLRAIDVLVLPYRFGTHSGWVELCYDGGVATVVPDCGHFREQHCSNVFALTGSTIDARSLLRAVTAAAAGVYAGTGAEDVSRRSFRAAQRRSVRDEHVAVYHDAISEPGSRRGSRAW